MYQSTYAKAPAYPRRLMVKQLIVAAVILNIPFFLCAAYIHALNMQGDNAVFIDFWGRWTVYSLWYLCYELYRKWL